METNLSIQQPNSAMCFVCGLENPAGLRLVFYETGPDEVTATYSPPEQFPLQRTPLQSSGGTAGACDGALQLNWNAFLAAQSGVLGVPFSSGDHVFVQAWFRDPSAVKGTNLSNALAFPIAP